MARLRRTLSFLLVCGLAAGCAHEAAPAAAATARPSTDTEATATGQGQPLPPAGVVRFDVPVEGAPARGAEHPLVTIVIFSDFQCPFCARARQTLDRLLTAYPQQLRVVFRNDPMPFHQYAMSAAEAAAEARAQGGDAAFWKMHDLLFSNQDALTPSDLEDRARRIGLDLDRFRKAMADHRHVAAILKDQALAVGLDVRGTPGQFVDGRPVMGAEPYEEIDGIVREEIALAKKMIAEGTPRDALYATLMKDATPPEKVDVPQDVVDHYTDARHYVPVDGSPIRGKHDALVTLVEFADFECPFCSHAQETLDALRKKYGDDLRIVFKNFPLPFHEHSMLAHEAAAEARAQKGDPGFWAMYDRLYADIDKLSRDDLEADAKAIGLNMRRFRKALDDQAHQKAITDDMALGQQVGVEGTPTFFINGHRLVGAQPLDAFETQIDASLAEAHKLLDEGVPRDQIYEKVTGGPKPEAQ